MMQFVLDLLLLVAGACVLIGALEATYYLIRKVLQITEEDTNENL